MARLTHPENGTVIHVDDEAAGRHQAAGWLADDEIVPEVDEAEAVTGDGNGESNEHGEDEGDEPEADTVAPHGNASAEKWAEYANALGVTIEDDADRNAIKAAITAAGK